MAKWAAIGCGCGVGGAGRLASWPGCTLYGVAENHRTIDRVTRILEEVVYRPGVTFAELTRALDAPKSTVHGFIRGLLAKGWLFESDRGFYLGPAVYGLTLVSGHIRAGSVTHEDLVALYEETGTTVFLGVEAGDHLVYVDEVGADTVEGFEARSNIRRTLVATPGGKALLAARPDAELEPYLRRRTLEEADAVRDFLEELDEIRKTRIATHVHRSGKRFAIATAVRNQTGHVVGASPSAGPSPTCNRTRRSSAECLSSTSTLGRDGR